MKKTVNLNAQPRVEVKVYLDDATENEVDPDRIAQTLHDEGFVVASVMVRDNPNGYNFR